MSKVLGEYCYPINLDEITNLDGLYMWYTNFNEQKYDEFANLFLQKAYDDNIKLAKVVENFICCQ